MAEQRWTSLGQIWSWIHTLAHAGDVAHYALADRAVDVSVLLQWMLEAPLYVCAVGLWQRTAASWHLLDGLE